LRFQSVDRLLLVGDLLENRIELGLSSKVVRVIGVGEVSVLLQREFALEKFELL
jgi:hypothetical protein